LILIGESRKITRLNYYKYHNNLFIGYKRKRKKK